MKLGKVSGEDTEAVVASWLAQFYLDVDGNLITPDLETVRMAAIEAIKQAAREQRIDLDDIISDNTTLAIEIAIYFIDGRPLDPQPGRYLIANAMATRRGITLRDMLENLLSRWRDLQAAIATVTTELDRLIEEINAASTIAEIEAVLASAVF